MGESYGAIFVSAECDEGYGVELLSQRDMFRAEPEGKWIRRDSLPNPLAHEVRKWQILIAGTGTLAPTELYGRCILADERLTGKCLGPDGLALTFKQPGSDINLYVYAFLATELGLAAIRSLSAGTKLLRPRLDMLVRLQIPIAPDAIVRRVAASIRRCVEGRERYCRVLRSARQVIEELNEVRDAYAMCAERKAHAVLWDDGLPTLRGWTYASSGGALRMLASEWSARLGDALQPDGIYHGLLRQRTPCAPPHGVALYSQRDVFAIHRVSRRIAHPGCDDRALFVPAGSLLLASRGQLTEGALFGKVELGDTFPPRSAATQDILRVLPMSPMLGVTYAFLASRVGQVLLRSAAVGTSIPILRLDLLKVLPFPSLSEDSCRHLSATVGDAVEARIAADQAETEAIRIVEEEVLAPWLA